MLAIPDPSFVLKDTVGEMYFVSAWSSPVDRKRRSKLPQIETSSA